MAAGKATPSHSLPSQIIPLYHFNLSSADRLTEQPATATKQDLSNTNMGKSLLYAITTLNIAITLVQ